MSLKKTNFWRGKLYLIPCSVTFCNALCGMSAIIYLIRNPGGEPVVPVVAVWLIFAAILFDLLDGYIARKLQAESMHGLHLDSMADLLSFGIAPAILIYSAGRELVDFIPIGGWLAWAAACFYVICAMWRLVNYNTSVLSGTAEKGAFSGLPSPAAALTICSMLLLLNRINSSPLIAAVTALVYAVLVGFLMVCRIRYMHYRKLVHSGLLGIRIALLALIAIAFYRFGIFTFVALVHFYLISGLVLEILEKEEECEEPVLETEIEVGLNI